ncbi:hypothetical protein AB9P05_10960 [Roseivirga sp. BDSF3-8]|uniref:hypothetical protein n=1 Tax=Roseivirga sp. BDSF3-8 TaxID=3241598 RepID=UPI003531CC59
MKIICTLLVIIFGLIQTFPSEKSENHILVSGTNVFMIPPPSFESSDEPKGFRNAESGSFIMVEKSPESSASEMLKSLSEMSGHPSFKINSRTDIHVSGFKGFFFDIEQYGAGIWISNQMLVVENDEAFTLINGVCPIDSVQLKEKIKESIYSTYMDSEIDW